MKKLIVAIVLCFASVGWSAAVDYSADASCKGYWPMEYDGSDVEQDASANNEDLTPFGGNLIPRSSTVPAGYTWDAYSRDFEFGDSEYMSHADGGTTDISGVNQNISIVGWVRIETLQASTIVVASKYLTTGDQRSYLLGVTSTGIIQGILSPDGGTANWAIALGNTHLATATWYHLGMVYNDTDIRLYLNGVLDQNDTAGANPKTYSAGIHNSTADALFCVGSACNSYYFDGLIDDVAIFNRALSVAEVLAIHDYGVTGEGYPVGGGSDLHRKSSIARRRHQQ